MTVYFAGESISDFQENTNSNAQDLGDAILTNTGPTTSDGIGSLFQNFGTTITGPLFATVSIAGTVANSLYGDFSLSNDPTQSTLSFWDAEGNNIFFCGFNVNSGRFEGRVQLRDGTTSDLDIGANNTGKYDFRIEAGVGLKIWRNRIILVDYSGDVGNAASSTNGVGRFGVGNGDVYATPQLSDIIVADFDTRLSTLETITVNSTATTDTSTGGDSTSIPTKVNNWERSTYETNNLVTFNADGQKVIYAQNNTVTIPAENAVAAVVMSHSGVQTGSSTVPNLTPIAVVGGTEYTGTAIPLSTSETYAQTIFETNPATGATWGLSEVNGLSLGLSLNT